MRRVLLQIWKDLTLVPLLLPTVETDVRQGKLPLLGKANQGSTVFSGDGMNLMAHLAENPDPLVDFEGNPVDITEFSGNYSDTKA